MRPIVAKRCVIWRLLNPASTRMAVRSVLTSVQLPALPLPKTVTSIPTRAIVHDVARDSSRMQMKDGDFSVVQALLPLCRGFPPLLASSVGYDEDETHGGE